MLTKVTQYEYDAVLRQPRIRDETDYDNQFLFNAHEQIVAVRRWDDRIAAYEFWVCKTFYADCVKAEDVSTTDQ
jgi:hypothetical protein